VALQYDEMVAQGADRHQSHARCLNSTDGIFGMHNAGGIGSLSIFETIVVPSDAETRSGTGRD
jgi:hypothetical protein